MYSSGSLRFFSFLFFWESFFSALVLCCPVQHLRRAPPRHISARTYTPSSSTPLTHPAPTALPRCPSFVQHTCTSYTPYQVDLVISVGGDGTVLSASHFLGPNVPLVGVNSDPNREEESSSGSAKRTDERRSFGALCMCTALDVEEELPKVCVCVCVRTCACSPGPLLYPT